MAEVAAAMDDRQRRIGEHTAREKPQWAVQALGEVPAGPAELADWERSAGMLGAYRQITGWDHPGEAIGPEPPRGNTEAWAQWHAAFAVMTEPTWRLARAADLELKRRGVLGRDDVLKSAEPDR
jgi:hypothetical protein